MLQIADNNSIGVYGEAITKVKSQVLAGKAPHDLFDEIYQDVLSDLTMDVFPRFKKSSFFKRYIQTKFIDRVKVHVKDFHTFRVLGRGGFGAVHACRKKNSGTVYAMKKINKKLVKVKQALDNVLEERNVLTMLKSKFVTNLKYALQDEENLYLIMDLMLGGDLKFHLINKGRFQEKRARFYAAEVLLGLEQVHAAKIIYRDMKLENVLLDDKGHCRISDLGLAVVTKVKIKGYAGTPGYTAPEMIRNKLYGSGADIFSFGVMLYRMLCGSKPFKGKVDRDLDKAVLERKPLFPKEVFSKEAQSLLTGLLQKKPEHRLGCGPRGVEEIKAHQFFETIDWGRLEAGYLDPPFVPNKYDVNAASLKDIGDFDRAKYRHVKLDDKFRDKIKDFEFVSLSALQDEMVTVLEKADPIPVVRVEHVDHCELHLTAVPVAAFLDDHHAQTRVKQGKYPGEVLTVVVLRLLAPLVELDDIGALQNLGLGLKLGHALGPVLAAAGRCAVGDGRVVLSNQRVGVAADRAGDQPEPRFLDARELAGLRQFLEQLVRLAVHGQQPDRRDRRQVTP